MKIKALIITAALIVASVASTMAQVYSANAVGYVNVSVPAGKTILANPLNNGDNHADTIMPLPDAATGMLLFRFDPSTQNYATGITFGGVGLGWVNVNTFDKTPPELFILEPGEAFFVQSIGAIDITFVGDVPQGDLSNPVYGSNNKNLLSSQVPQEAPLGDPTKPDTTLGFPAQNGDLVFLWDDPSQNFTEGVTYVQGLGWVNVNTFEPINNGDGPILPVARGFFVQKQGDLSQSWDRTFSVN
jgi:hypothetical protein